LVLAVTAAVGVAVAVGILAATQQLEQAQPFATEGLVRYGLPAFRVLHDLAAALTIGLFVLAVWLVTPEPNSSPDGLSGTRQWLMHAGFVASMTWAGSSAAVLILTASDVSGIPVGGQDFAAAVISFVSQTDLGHQLAYSLLLIIIAASVAVFATRVAVAAWAVVLAILAVLPLAFGGHAAGLEHHLNATDSLAIHLVAVCIWVGGLAALVLAAQRLGVQLPAVASRYSTLAGGCFVAVAATGLINTWLRLGSLSQLSSTYGVLAIAKAAALIALGFVGWAHRRVTLRRIRQNRGWFVRLAVMELFVMGATIGLAVALSRSAPPSGAAVDHVAEVLGFPTPEPLTAGRYFTAFYPDLLWLLVSLGLAAAYAAGAVRLRRRGDAWSWLRTTAWLAGCGLLIFVTSGGPGVYGRLQFSTHMLQHMSLMIMVPFFLVLGAPVTLALRALPRRTDGSFGLREVVLKLVHSSVLRVLGHPVVSAALLIVSLVAFYYTWLFPLAMITHLGHILMTAHFVLVGYLFIWSLIGVDPGPARPSYPLRLLVLLVTLSFHAFFGVSLMESGTVLAPQWWAALGRTNQAALLADQQTGGAIAWATGDLPSLLLGLALLIGWIRSDTAEARRRDRQADRDSDAELRRYNEQLAAMARRDEHLGSGG